MKHALVWSLIIASMLPGQRALAQIAPVSRAVVSGTVADAAGTPVSDASVVLTGPRSFTTRTDAKGQFVVNNVPFGFYRITVTASVLGQVMREHIDVEGDVSVTIAYNITLAGMKIIGRASTTAGATFNVTPASIASVNPLTAAFQGQTVWKNILEQIPGVTIGDLDSGASNISGIPGNPFSPIQVSVNGGLPYETATLFDGMPLIGINFYDEAPGFGTDLEYYPLNGFGGADVVRGPGAASATIVDSIGGSLVLHPPSPPSNTHFDLSVSNDIFGGEVVNMLGAIHFNDRLSLVATYGIDNSPGPYSPSGRYIVAEALPPGTVNGYSFNCYGAPACALGSTPSPPNGGYANAYGILGTGFLYCCVPVDSSWNQHTGSATLRYDVAPGVRAQVYWSGLSTLGDSGINPYWEVLFTPPAGYTGSIPASISYLSNELAPGQDDIGDHTSLLEEKVSANIGSSFLQVAALQNRNWDVQSYATPAGSTTAELYGGGEICSNTSPNCSTGAYVPVVFNGATYTITYPQPNWFRSVAAVNSRDLLISYSVPMSDRLALGTSYVQSYFNNPEDGAYACTEIPYGTFAGPSQQSGSVSSTTGETRLYVNFTPSTHLSLDVSQYFVSSTDHVQDNPNDSASFTDLVNSYSAPRLGVVWRPSSNVAVRGAAGGGIAFAPLSYIGYASRSAPISCLAGICTQTLANLKLQPERSFGFDLGTDLRVGGGRSNVVSLDIYRSNLYGQVFGSVTTGTYFGEPLYTTQYENLGSSRYEGLIIDLRHDVPSGIYWHLAAGLTRAYVVSVPAGFYNGPGCTMCENLYVVPGINFNGGDVGAFGGVAVPYSQATAALGYRWRRPGTYFELSPVYYGKNNSYYRPAFAVLNATASYQISTNATLSLYFSNLTNIYGNNIATRSLANILGAPTVVGPSYALWGAEYGPRSIVGTMAFHI